jgi:hypothetical protein
LLKPLDDHRTRWRFAETYVYGYLNRVRSSRMIERETRRNIEVMWLVNRVSPTYKTIADFRRTIRQPLSLSPGIHSLLPWTAIIWWGTAAIDGTRIEGAASRKQVVMPKRLAEQMAALDQKIEEYLRVLNEADQHESEGILSKYGQAGSEGVVFQ